jgi:hypothetical protein
LYSPRASSSHIYWICLYCLTGLYLNFTAWSLHLSFMATRMTTTTLVMTRGTIFLVDWHSPMTDQAEYFEKQRTFYYFYFYYSITLRNTVQLNDQVPLSRMMLVIQKCPHVKEKHRSHHLQSKLIECKSKMATLRRENNIEQNR